MILKNWNHFLKEFIRLLNKSLAFLTIAKARSFGKHFIFMLSIIRREKSCFADEMGLIIKSRSHFLYLRLSLLSLKDKGGFPRCESSRVKPLTWVFFALWVKLGAFSVPGWHLMRAGAVETVTLRAGVGSEDSRSSRLLGQVRTTCSKDGWWLWPRDLGQQGRKEAQRRNVTLAPTGKNITVHGYLLSTPGGDYASPPSSDPVTSFGQWDRAAMTGVTSRKRL